VAGVANRVAAATAAVVVKGRRSVGSAVLVDGRHLVTARHVVAKWDGQGWGWGPAVEKVSLVFPGVSEGEVTARPVSLPQVGATDVAVLDLGEESPEWLPEPVGVWAGRRLPDRVDVIGFPTAERALEGVWREFTVSGPAADGAVQLRWEEDAGTLPGHSGGPVVEHDTGALVGVLVQGSKVGRFDRFVPVTVIAGCWPGLPQPWVFAPADARAHVRGRALGQRSRVQGGDLFRGRAVALAKIKGWLEADQCPGRPLVVTGQPGAGKSAVLGRAALGAERDHPGAGMVFHARGATHAGFLDAVAAATGTSAAGGRDELLDALVAQGDSGGLFAVMVDALDEAATAQERGAVAQTLSELARIQWLRVVVATRPLAAGDRYSVGSLLPQLRVSAAGVVSLLDLDVDPYYDPEALRQFAGALLAQEGVTQAGTPGCAWESYRANPKLRDSLAEVIASRADPNFLVDAMTSVPLSEAEVVLDPAAPGFDPQTLPASVGEAFDKYLNSLPAREKANTRALLTALAFARGSGVGDGLWLRFAHALGCTEVGKVDLDVLRDITAADYLLQTASDQSAGEQAGSVARLFHQALIDELLIGRARHDHQAGFTRTHDFCVA
jgi:V8-like Glu-specific endopeptidase